MPDLSHSIDSANYGPQSGADWTLNLLGWPEHCKTLTATLIKLWVVATLAPDLCKECLHSWAKTSLFVLWSLF